MQGPIQVFPTIYNRSAFIMRDHPVLHPDNQQAEYDAYWGKIEKYCLEGLWGLDQKTPGGPGGWRYMSPRLFRYINMTVMEKEDDTGSLLPEIGPPDLIDTAWMMDYGWFAARSFSGFEGDEEFTCLRGVKHLEDGTPAHPYDEIQLRRSKDSVINPKTGKYKKYIDAIEYLYKTHEKPLGRPLYFNSALDFMVLMSRRGGKSWYMANAIGSTFDFYGKRYYDDTFLKNPTGVPVLVIASNSEKSTTLLNKFVQVRNWQFNNLGTFKEGKTTYPGFFRYNFRGSLEPNNAKKPYEAYYKKYTKTKKGTVMDQIATGQVIYHSLVTASNSDVGVGGAMPEVFVEETGLVSNLRELRGKLKPVQIRTIKFGSMMMIGTGGNFEKIDDSKYLFENAEANLILGYPDVYENRSKKTGLFIPGYMVHLGYKDEEGNTMYQEAWDYEQRLRKAYEDDEDDHGLEMHCTSYPNVPTEMFMSVATNPFPVKFYTNRYKELDLYKWDRLIGQPVRTKWSDSTCTSVTYNEVDWKSAKVLDGYKTSEKRVREGCPVMFEPPDEDVLIKGLVNYGALYKAVYDPIKDENGGISDAAFMIYKGAGKYLDRQVGNIVYSYYGRLHDPDDIHNIVIQACALYNCKVLFELNAGDFLSFVKRHKYLHYCQPTPYYSIGKHVQKPTKKWTVGINMGTELIQAADKGIIKWSATKWKIDDDGKQLYNPDKLLDKRLMDEILHFDPEKNFDAISAFRLLMLWLENEDRPISEKEKVQQHTQIIGATKKYNPYEQQYNPWK